MKSELINAIIGALEAPTAMSTQALASEAVPAGLSLPQLRLPWEQTGDFDRKHAGNHRQLEIEH